MASIRNFLPFTNAGPTRKTKTATADIQDPKVLSKVYKLQSLAIGATSSGSGSRASFEEAPYDFDKIIQAIDTDSYVKQAFNKYRELFWKEGWRITGENPEATDYVRARIDLMELTMRRPFQDVLSECADQLFRFANGFLAKARGDISQYFPQQLTPVNGAKLPVSGFYVVPAETVKIARDVNNSVIRYQQESSGGGGAGGKLPEWDPVDMIHFTYDRKPGRIYGTPFLVSVLDDVIALRQIEEDIQNLVHRELFPLYIYQVGTESEPAEPAEIDKAALELANLRTEGGLIIPERHNVDVLGADGESLSAESYLRYFQERVVVGLGLAPHHLGIMNAGGNRSVTDRLDIALYDKVKTYQRYFAHMVRILIINELLMEGGFDPVTVPEDRVFFQFNEIDVETQIKKENAVIQKWNSNLLDQAEARMQLGEDIDVDEGGLLMALTARMSPNSAAQPQQQDNPQRPDAAKPSTGGAPNPPNNKRDSGNKAQPTNQFGRRSGPKVRQSIDDDFLNEMVDLLDDNLL